MVNDSYFVALHFKRSLSVCLSAWTHVRTKFGADSCGRPYLLLSNLDAVRIASCTVIEGGGGSCARTWPQDVCHLPVQTPATLAIRFISYPPQVWQLDDRPTEHHKKHSRL
jgi:hypothetical protein